MASDRSAMAAIKAVGKTFVTAGKDWLQDNAPRHAASLAYYTLIAMGPLLLIATGVLGILLGSEAGEQRLAQSAERFIGPQGAEAVHMLAAGTSPGGGQQSIAIGLVVLLFAAAAVFRHLRISLDRMWEVVPRKGQGWKEKAGLFLRKNLLAFTGLFAVGVLLFATIALNAVLAGLAERTEALPGQAVWWRLVTMAGSVALATGLFAFLYKVLPDVHIAWRDTLLGALATAVLFVLGQAAVGQYLATTAIDSRYGAAGAVVLLLIWIYYSALVVLYGAELTQAWANRFGSRIRPDRFGVPVQEAVQQRHGSPSTEGT